VRGRLLPILLLAALSAAQTTPPRAVEVLREFDRIGGQTLWPGFEPRTIPVEIFDGTNTYLFHHPKPPERFQPLGGAAGVFVFPGQHETVRANTGTEVNGVPTATADISQSRAGVPQLAALLIHETFHVYEKRAHPTWAANEGELFVYPFDDEEVLALRRLETVALVRSLAAKEYARSRCWAELALEMREKRFAKMTPGAVAYERGTELNEGLAQYVEYKAIGRAAALTADDFPVELIRQRGYATGQVFALLLDRFGSGPTELGAATAGGNAAENLDEALKNRFLMSSIAPKHGCRTGLKAKEEDARHRARQEVGELTARRAGRLRDFLAAPGWRIEVVAGKEPLWPQGFDPWNVASLGDKRVLHARWVKLGNSGGVIEVLGHPSLTEGAGPHPLFNGARKLVITGLPEPKAAEEGGKVTIEVSGAKGNLTGTLERDAQTIRIRMP
jgi:hypothetical protein